MAARARRLDDGVEHFQRLGGKRPFIEAEIDGESRRLRRLRGRRLGLGRATAPAGLLMGAVCSVEFLGLFVALDLTSVARASVIFYSMPLWLALIGHFALPGERLTPLKVLGLVLALAGVGLL